MKHLDLDGARLLFDRDSGRNVLMRGKETEHLVQSAPRVVQMSITNSCNKTCGFCYRDLESKSRWKEDSIVEFAKYLSDWGVLELALGGGEPTVFPRFADLVQKLWKETSLSINFTTNGTRLNEAFLRKIKDSVGQIQISVYDDENVNEMIAMLVKSGVRFGLNYLVTPRRLRTLEVDLLSWASMGVRDVLLLSYKGTENSHLNTTELLQLEQSILRSQVFLKGKIQLKLDVCWSSRLPKVPQLFYEDDCRAGSLFMSVTSDKRVVSCSFSDGGISFDAYDELPSIYKILKEKNLVANVPGCARLPQFGMNTKLTPAVDYPEVRL